MRRGFSLAELAVALAILGIITALVLPRWSELLDWVAVDRTAVEVATALAVTRNAAVLGSTRARLLIADDSLRIDRHPVEQLAPARQDERGDNTQDGERHRQLGKRETPSHTPN